MKMYEIILDILNKKGPAPYSTICEEMNDRIPLNNNRNKPVQLAHIKSVVSRKKDLFSVENGVISIREEKKIVCLTVHIEETPGPSYTVKVDFEKNRFALFEFVEEVHLQNKPRSILTGNIEKFKSEIYRLKIWNWNMDYQPETLVLDGTNWVVKLQTKGKVYESRGHQCFPQNWTKFCKTLSNLVGIEFK